MTDKQIIVDGVDVSEWTDEEVRYKFEKHSPKAIRQIAFDLYKQLKRQRIRMRRIKKEKAEIKKYLSISDKTIIQRLEELQEFKDKLKISEDKCKQALDEIEGIADDYNRAEKTSQYYRDGFDQI